MNKTPVCLFGILLLFCTACSQLSHLNPLVKKSPRTIYSESLKAAGLTDSAMGKAWIIAGESALNDSLRVAPPYQEVGYFRAEEPTAYGFSFYLKEGHTCEINLRVKPDSMRVFLELFGQDFTADTPSWKWLSEVDSEADQLKFTVEKTGFYQLRLQAELLATGSYELDIGLSPSIGFPVSGGKNHDIGSFWGDPRDGGKRKHKGVDIFAKKGTPVLATGPGTVSRVRTGGLGGKTVWVRDERFGHRQYFAHLDEQLVSSGQSVEKGDTLGTVGNTGNARTTPPHLHYGIYKRGGAVDPLPFIRKEKNKFAKPNIDLARLGDPSRIGKRSGKLYRSPYKKSKVIRQLAAHTPVRITGGAEGYYRITTTYQQNGFIKKRYIVPLDKSIGYFTASDEVTVLNSPDNSEIPVGRILSGERVAVVGKIGDAQLVKGKDGVLGWVR